MTSGANRSTGTSLGIHIEAVPYLASKKTSGAVFLYGDEPTWESNTGFYPVLTGLPSSITSSVNPWDGSLSLSALQASVSATATVLDLLFHYPRPLGNVGADDGAGGFTGDIAAGATSITVTTGQTLSSGDYLWVNNECLYIDSASNTVDEWTLTVTRGIGGSPDEDHTAGTNVYLDCPLGNLEPIVTLYLYDWTDESTSVLWRGFLDQPVDTDDSQNSVIIRGSEMIQRLTDLELATNPIKFISSEQLRKRSTSTGGLSGSVEGTIQPVAGSTLDWVRDDQTAKILRVGDYIGSFEWDSTTETLTSNGSSVLNARITEGTAGDYLESGLTIREVLALDREGRYGLTVNPFNGITGNLHFAGVALSLLLSTGDGTNDPATGTFDVLGSQWGCGFPSALIDEDSWDGLISTSSGQIDQLLLGYDGPFEPWEIIRDLLVSNGCFLALTKDGLLGVREFSTITAQTIGDVMQAYHWSVVEPAKIPLARGEVRPNTRAVIGELAHGRWDPDVIGITPLLGTRRDQRTYAQSPFSYQMPWSYVGKPSRDARQDFIDAMAARRAENVPTITVKVPFRHFSQQLQSGDSTARILPDLGDWIRLRSSTELSSGESVLEVIGPDGERVDMNSTVLTFLGRTVGYTLQLSDFVVEAKVLLTNWTFGDAFPRYVAPCHKVLSYDSGTNWMTLDSGWISSSGISGFIDGDSVEIVMQSGKQWHADPQFLTVNVVDNTGPFRVQLNADPLAAIPADPPVYLRLTDADNYANAGWAGTSIDPTDYYPLDQADRQWAYIAGTDGEVGATDQDDPDFYVE